MTVGQQNDRWVLSGVLLVMGAGWGLTQPLAKISVSTGYQHFGLIFWQLAIGAVLMAGICALRGKKIPISWRTVAVCLIISFTGTLIPNSASYQAIAHLPAGVHSILISLVPIMAFPMAIALGLEPFGLRRLAGLTLGLVGVSLLILPETSLPDPAMLPWIPVAIIAPICYAFEGNYVAKWGTAGLDPLEVLFGASLIGAVVALPLAIGSGQFISPLHPWGAADWALVGASVIHVAVYSAYVWMVGRAGSVFAAQVSYLVTGFGVFWAMLILGESYSPYIWAALALVLAGVAMVQPRQRRSLAETSPIGETQPQNGDPGGTNS